MYGFFYSNLSMKLIYDIISSFIPKKNKRKIDIRVTFCDILKYFAFFFFAFFEAYNENKSTYLRNWRKSIHFSNLFS